MNENDKNEFEAKVQENVEKAQTFWQKNQTKILTGAVVVLSLKNRALRNQNAKLRGHLVEAVARVAVSEELIKAIITPKS